MTDLNDKELLFKAIEDYELYSLSQRAVLKILLDVSIEGIASVNTKYLMQSVNLSRFSIYLILKQLEHDQFVERIKLKGTRHDSFKINYSRLNRIIQLYLKKTSNLFK